jgi:arginine utilization regulatory protein
MSELLSLKTQFETLLANLEEGIHIVDERGVSIYYNDAASKIDGLTTEEVLNRHVLEIFPSLTDANSTLMAALKTGKETHNKLQTFTNYKGKKIVTVNTTLPIRIKGRIVGAMEISKDVTNVKDMSERISDLQAMLFGHVKPAQRKIGQAVYTFDDIIGESQIIRRLKNLAKRAALSSSPILIWGETGTGKELLVQAIHNAGPRRDFPFIAQDCAALPSKLLEGMLFGTIKGGFTDAEDRAGLFEMANGGTLFLDEISSMPPEVQAKLLRVLQEGALRRLGDTQVRMVDVRVITACSDDPVKAVEEEQLREDLFYRINVVTLKIPALRERREDIKPLVEHFIKRYRGDQKIILYDEVIEVFDKYPWPGNVRELEHAIEGALIMMEGDTIKPEHLPLQIRSYFMPQSDLVLQDTSMKLDEALQKVETDFIKNAMERAGGNISKAARILGIPRQTLQYKLRKMKREGIVYAKK